MFVFVFLLVWLHLYVYVLLQYPVIQLKIHTAMRSLRNTLHSKLNLRFQNQRPRTFHFVLSQPRLQFWLLVRHNEWSILSKDVIGSYTIQQKWIKWASLSVTNSNHETMFRSSSTSSQWIIWFDFELCIYFCFFEMMNIWHHSLVENWQTNEWMQLFQQPDSSLVTRAPFLTKHLWVTQYSPTLRYLFLFFENIEQHSTSPLSIELCVIV